MKTQKLFVLLRLAISDNMSYKGYKQTQEHKDKIALAHIGMKASKEAKVNMSLAHKGKHYSPETEFKGGVYQGHGFQKGNIPHNYKGNITSTNYKIRTSNKYRKWREYIFKQNNYICQECNQRGGNLHAHHIKKFADYPELRFDIDNGITLCVPCHKNSHKREINNVT